MGESQDGGRTFSVREAVKAQAALRDAAGLGPEEFPVQAFVGMISDEVQSLRERGWTDEHREADCGELGNCDYR